MKKTFLLLTALMTATISAQADVSTASKNLKEKYPATTFNKISESPVKGIYEVMMGNNVAYTNKEGRYFIFGNLYDMHEQKDITSQPEKTTKSYFPDAKQLKDAIKEVKGSGQRKLVVFSDPDCPFCGRLEQELLKLDNVTIYTFLYPLEQLHPTAKTTAINIWCSKDKVKAYKDYMLANTKPKIETCSNPVDRNIQLGASMGVQGTPSIIFEDGTMIPGAMTSEAIEEQFAKTENKERGNAK